MTASAGVLRLPSTVHFGMGARKSIPETVAGIGNRAFVVADPFLATTSEFLETTAALRDLGVEVAVYTDIHPELPVASIGQAAAEASRFGPDVIVGYGGGSALDASKLVGILVVHGGPLSRYYGENAVPGPTLPVVAVPTTAGTGSEVTPIAVVSDPDRALKVGISSPFLVPRTAIVDPSLTFGAPPAVTAHSGIDALAHAIESYTAAHVTIPWHATMPVYLGSNSLTESLSLEAITRIGSALATAYREPLNEDARSEMALGSLQAGMAFGSTGTHLAHALQYPIGAATHTPHGLGTGLMIPYVLELCNQVAPARVAGIGTALGVEGNAARRATGAIDRVADLAASVGIPRSLEEIGVKRDDLPRFAELALTAHRLVSMFPTTVDSGVLLRLLEAAWLGDRTMLR